MGYEGLKPDVTARFLDKVQVLKDGCWEWTGAKVEQWNRGKTVNGHGYGFFSPKNGMKNEMAHRFAYEWFIRDIPQDLELDHVCRNRGCVNPWHVEPVTHRENLMRSVLTKAEINAAKTHCPNGHPFDDANTYNTPCGRRQCRECVREHKRQYRARCRAEGRPVK